MDWYEMKGFVYPSKPRPRPPKKLCNPCDDWKREQNKIIKSCPGTHGRGMLQCIQTELKKKPCDECFHVCTRFGHLNHGWMDLGGRGEDGFLFDTVDCSQLCYGKPMEYRKLEPFKSFHEMMMKQTKKD